MVTKTHSLSEAVDLTRSLYRGNAWEWAVAQAAHVTGWTVDQIEAAYDRQFHAWCAANGYDYT